MTADLTTDLAGMRLATPVVVAAGCGGTGRELEPFLGAEGLAALGAFTTRTVTLDPRTGGPQPRVVETPAGLVHHTGGQNPGLQGFLATELPWLAQHAVRTVVSVAGGTLAEWGELARRVGAAPGVSAVEVDLSAANREAHGRPFGAEPYQAGKVLAVVRRDVPRGVPVLVKLVPEAPVVDVARACADNGADALVLTHGPAAMTLDPAGLRPAPATGGRLSGPAVHALALRRVHEVHAALPTVPLVGSGGVRTGWDALAMLLAGATAVQVGSAHFLDPAAAARVAIGLAAELEGRDLAHPADAVGLAHRLENHPAGGPS
ncbi:MAG: dihydroorotate dehydrogenase catalytic subunit [Nocardioides sp.]